MFKRVIRDKFFIIIFISAFICELLSVFVLYKTLGHAGPEGNWGDLGWLSFAFNVIGIGVAAALEEPSDAKVLFPIRVFLIQFFLIGLVTYAIRYYMLRKKDF